MSYSALKAAWHIDRIQQLRDGKQTAPVELQFILSDLCNQDCFFCAYRSEVGLSSEQFVEWTEEGERIRNPVRLMKKEKAIEILEDAWGLGTRSIIFTGGGEPTVHPKHLDVFTYALELGFQCSLNTNGILLRTGWEDVFPRFAYVRYSIDAGCAEDYAEVRRVPPAQYRRALDNLAKMTAVCAGTDCIVGAGYVVTPNNYKALVQGVRAIRDTGAAYVRLAAMQSTAQEKPYEGIMSEVRALLDEVTTEETDTFEVVDMFDTALGKQAAAPLCGMQLFVLYVGANLKVYRCCYTAYTGIGEIGDLSQQTFGEWFASEQKYKAIGEFDARSCFVCPLEHKNEIIRYMVDPAPEHVNFV